MFIFGSVTNHNNYNLKKYKQTILNPLPLRITKIRCHVQIFTHVREHNKTSNKFDGTPLNEYYTRVDK